MSLPAIIAVCIAAWLAGAAFGYSLRSFLSERGGAAAPRRGRRRRRASYYFSDDGESWGDTRWRRRVAIISEMVVAVLLTTSGAFALMNYKGRANAAAGYRSDGS